MIERSLRFALTAGLLIASASCSGASFTTSGGPSAGGDDGPVGRAYAGWTHESCGGQSWCGTKLAAAAGIMPDGQRGGALDNPKSRMQNPDPEWLPGWDQLPSDERDARQFFEALHLAASRKSWLLACEKSYAAVKQGIDERAAATTKAIEAARAETDPYARLQALLALPHRPTGTPTKLAEFEAGFDAAAYEAERAISEELRARDKLWLRTTEELALGANARELLAPRLDESLEPVAFCMRAAEKGYDGLPPLAESTSDPAVEAILPMVKPLFSEAQRGELEAQRQAHRETAAKALGAPEAKRPENIRPIAISDDIASFRRDGDKALIKTSAQREYGRSIGDICSDEKKRIGACPTMKVKKSEIRTITFDTWPEGLVLEKGDAISFFGIVEASDVQGTGTPVEKLTETIRGLHLRSVEKKDGTKLDYLAPQRPQG